MSVTLEHPAGFIYIAFDRCAGHDQPAAGVMRTVRRLFEGYAFTKHGTGFIQAA